MYQDIFATPLNDRVCKKGRRSFNFDEDSVIFFGGLPKNVPIHAVLQYLEDSFGKVWKIKMDVSKDNHIKHRSTLIHRGSGLAEFYRIDDADRATKEKSHYLEGRPFFIRKAMPNKLKQILDSKVQFEQRKLHISRLPRSATLGMILL